MKLELKHLAPYLPYGLNTQFWVNDAAYVKLMVDEKRDKLLTSQNVHFVLTYCKPILHPLSDLTKLITVPGYNDGKEFVPINHWYPTYPDFKYFKQITHEFIMKIGNVKDQFPMQLSLSDWNLLYQWHFDLEGLIESGLAIDVNNLKK